MASRGEFGVRYSTLDTDSDREQPFAAPGPNAGLSYEDLSNRVASSVTQINSNVASLQRLFKQTSKAVPGSRYHVQLSSVQKTTTDLVKLTSENMHRMEGVSTASMSAATKKRHVLHLERLRANFKKALSKFNAMTKAIVDREREAIGEVRRNVSLTQGGIQEDDIDDADDAVEDEKLLQSRQALEQQAEQDAINHQAVRQREAALRALENDILDVNDIFRDLSQMVHEQGTVVDHIEGNIDATAVEVEAAGTALKLGARYQNRVRTKKCVIAGAVAAVLSVIALIIVLASVNHK